MPYSLILIVVVGLIVWAAPRIQLHWILWRATSAKTGVRVERRSSSPSSLLLEISISGRGRLLTITEVCVARSLWERVGVEAPAGFSERAYREEADAEKAGGLVEMWNEQWVRYVGEL